MKLTPCPTMGFPKEAQLIVGNLDSRLLGDEDSPATPKTSIRLRLLHDISATVEHYSRYLNCL